MRLTDQWAAVVIQKRFMTRVSNQLPQLLSERSRSETDAR